MRRLLLILLVLMLFIVGCQVNSTDSSDEIKISGIKSITIKILPSPPKMKVIDKNEDIEKVVSYINSIEKERINQDEINGWEVYIQINGEQHHAISFVGDLINIDDIWYHISEDELKKFRELYKDLDYSEVDITN